MTYSEKVISHENPSHQGRPQNHQGRPQKVIRLKVATWLVYKNQNSELQGLYGSAHSFQYAAGMSTGAERKQKLYVKLHLNKVDCFTHKTCESLQYASGYRGLITRTGLAHVAATACLHGLEPPSAEESTLGNIRLGYSNSLIFRERN